MRTKILLTLVILFSILLGALAVYIPLTQKETVMKQKLNESAVQSQNLQQQVEGLQQTVSGQIIEKKQAALADTKEGVLFFTQQTTRLSPTEYQVDIYLKGDAKTTADAVDLVLTYPQTVRIKEIRKGTSFLSYPRLIDRDGTVTVTGVAMPQGDTFAYGKANEVYATVIAEKTDSKTAAIELNAKDSQAYLNGTPILDFTQSFQKIDL